MVLQGHDHTYSRSKLLYGDGQTHGTYEFRLNADGSDYDWDNAFNTQTDEKIPLYPEEGDTAGTALHNAFQADNGCYTIEDTTGNTVVNPKGTLYMTANSASGSKFYELIPTQQDYCQAQPELAAQLLGHRHGQRQLLHHHLPDHCRRQGGGD